MVLSYDLQNLSYVWLEIVSRQPELPGGSTSRLAMLPCGTRERCQVDKKQTLSELVPKMQVRIIENFRTETV